MAEFWLLDMAIDFDKKAQKLRIRPTLKKQLDKAASSIGLNLAEGNAKYTQREKRRYYQTAYGSAKECRAIFRMASLDGSEIDKLADRLAAGLYRLVKSEIKTLNNNRTRADYER